jgi:hypothetical protein
VDGAAQTRYNSRFDVTDSSKYRTAPLQGWQRTNVVAAANYLREQLARTPGDSKLLAAYEGLLDLLDPSRLLVRKQREMADAARQAAASIKAERRSQDRRRAERRKANLGPPGAERRTAQRRTGGDRRRG